MTVMKKGFRNIIDILEKIIIDSKIEHDSVEDNH